MQFRQRQGPIEKSRDRGSSGGLSVHWRQAKVLNPGVLRYAGTPQLVATVVLIGGSYQEAVMMTVVTEPPSVPLTVPPLQ